MKFVIVTKDDVMEARRLKIGSLQTLVLKFKKSHGLTFKEEDFLDKSKFKFYADDSGNAYKVVWVGDE